MSAFALERVSDETPMRILTRGVAVAAAAVMCAAVLARVAAWMGPADPAVHEIRLVVREMSYHAAGNPEPNPTLRVRAGERVRLVLTNTDAGMAHDFVVADWAVATRLLKGESADVVEFVAPTSRGAHAYNCTPHAATMRGTIVVE